MRAWHTQQIPNHQSDKPLVAVSDLSFNDFEGGSRFFVYTKDQPNFFAIMCAIISQLNFNIFDARIYYYSRWLQHGYLYRFES